MKDMASDLSDYFEALREYTRWARVPGLDVLSEPMPLADIFVEPRVQQPSAARKQRRGSDSQAEIVAPAQPVFGVLRDEQSLVIVGEPGQGKSTLLRQFCATLAADSQTKTPLLVELGRKRERSAGLTEPYEWLKERVPDPLRHALGPRGWQSICNLLEAGAVHLLLDAFDELDRGARQQLIELLPALSHNGVVVTSRPDAIRSAPVTGAKTYELQALQSAQIGTLAANVCSALAIQFRVEEFQTPLRTVQQAAGRELGLLAGNPLFLSFMCLTAIRRWSEGTLGEFPRRPAPLIGDCVDALVAWHTQHKPNATWPTELDASAVIRILSPLALQTFRGAGRITPEDLEKLAKDDRAAFFQHLVSARFVEQRYRDYFFPLETFREYFAARAVAASRQPFKEVEPHLHDGEWRQVILYAVGSAGTIRSSLVVLALPTYSRWLVAGIGPLVRILAGLLGSSIGGPKAVGETGKEALKEIGPALQGPLQRWHARSVGSAEFFIRSILRHRSSFEKILRRDLMLAALCAGAAQDVPKRLAVRIAGKLIARTVRTLGSYLGRYQDTLAAAARAPAMRDRLLEMTHADNAERRAAAAQALAQVASERVVRDRLIELIKDATESPSVTWAATQALREAASEPGVRARLLELTRDDGADVRKAATDALSDLAQESPVHERMLQLTHDDTPRVRWFAVAALIREGVHASLRDRLLELTRDDDSAVRGIAVDSLQRLADDALVRDRLLDLTRDDDNHLANLAVESAQAIGDDPRTRQRLLEVLQAPRCDRSTRRVAARALRSAALESEVRDQLLDVTRADDAIAREAAVESLEWVAQDAVVHDRLLDLTHDGDADVQFRAVEVLSLAAHVPSVRDRLLVLTCSADRHVRVRAVRSLQAVANELVVRDRLLELLAPGDDYATRRAVMEVLRSLPAERVGRDRLRQLTQDRDNEIKFAALRSLATLQGAATPDVLALAARFARYGRAGDEHELLDLLLHDWEQQERTRRSGRALSDQ
jgi:hypothetical protein